VSRKHDALRGRGQACVCVTGGGEPPRSGKAFVLSRKKYDLEGLQMWGRNRVPKRAATQAPQDWREALGQVALKQGLLRAGHLGRCPASGPALGSVRCRHRHSLRPNLIRKKGLAATCQSAFPVGLWGGICAAPEGGG
jgi:hypothetical protein